MIGQTISHYRILGKLGEGGMGVVYKAHDTELDRDVALKFLTHSAAIDETEQARFLQEARAAAILNHPNICTVHALDKAGDQQFIVMEYVDGSTLRKAAPTQQTQPAIDYAIQIGDALQEAHSNGIVHRDVKTDNIMVNSKNQIKVMDFGLAKLKGSLKLTKTTSTVGTLAYMAPEQIRGEEVDARGDIFSFGVVLYEMLTGRTPFRGEHEAAILYSIVNEPAVPIEKYLPDVPPELIHIVNRALEKDPEDRYQSAHDMVIDLRRLKKETSRVRRIAPSLNPPDEQATGAHGSPKTSGFSSRKRLALLFSAIFVCAAVIAWMAISIFLKNGTFDYGSLQITKMTSSGDILKAVISPDGQYIVYSTRASNGGILYLKHIPTGSTTKVWQVETNEAIPPSSLTFSPDGNYLYFLYKNNLYRLARLGGEAKIIVRGHAFDFAISPDGKRLLCRGAGGFVIPREDGSEEKKIARDTTGRYGWQSLPEGRPWSTDGRLIALIYSPVDGRYGLRIHDLIDSSDIEILNPLWSRIINVVWTEDGKSLLLSGKRNVTDEVQLWSIPYPKGEPRQLTSNVNGFSSVSASADARSLLAIQAIYTNSLWVLPSDDEFKVQKVPTGDDDLQGWVDWTADNRILFVTVTPRDRSVNAMSREGSNLTTLYSDTLAFDLMLNVGFSTLDGAKRQVLVNSPQMSRDLRAFYFASGENSLPGIWKVDLTVGSRERIYREEFSGSMALSADEDQLYIEKDWNILRIRNDGKPIDTLFAENKPFGIRISPDGSRIACNSFNRTKNRFETMAIDVKTGKLLQTLEIPSPVEWMPDGRGLSFVSATNNTPNIWTQSLAGGRPKQITHFPSDEIAHFKWSRDGKYLAVVRRTLSVDLYLLTAKK